MDATETIEVEVVYALPMRQTVIALKLQAGATLALAIERSAIAERHRELDLSRAKVGIHGRVCVPGTLLRDGDRVEIYRPLSADPKEIRRRAAAGKPRRPG